MTRARITLMSMALVAISAAALIIVAAFAVRPAAAGYLLALNYSAAFPLGALALRMIHRLTGGAWGEALDPVLRPLSLTTPALLVLAIPVLLAAPALFSWTHGAGAERSVGEIYLNAGAYAVRSLVALGGLSVFAAILPAPGHRGGALIAAVGLVFYAIAVSVLGLDWVLATEAPFFSTSFGASVAFTQLLAALACAAVFAQRDGAIADLGALMLVVTLGITYTDFMAVLVMWYGDVPAKVFWFAERVDAPWRAFAIAAFLLASAAPIVLLLFARMRASRAALRGIGGSSLAGLAFYQSWLLAPPFGTAVLATGVLALALMVALMTALVTSGWAERLEARGRPAHG